MTERTDLRALADATPPSRERAVDVVRAAAIVAVVVGHWTAVVLVDRGDGLRGANLLHLWGPAQPLSWVFQVIPALFLVGGYANAASWRSTHRTAHALAWLGDRARRLLVPTTVLVVVGTVAAVVAPVLGAEERLVRTTAWLAVFPLWFLALYVLLVATTPLLAPVEDRFGWRLVAALAGAAVVVDALHVHAGVPYVGEANYVLVWAAVHTAGMSWQRQGWPTARPVAAALCVGGAVVAVLLVRYGPYPAGMLYTPGSTAQNSAPPTTALLAYAAAQCGLVLLLRPALERVGRSRLWVPVVAVNAVAMSVYVWHMVPVVAVAVPAYLAGALREPEPMSGTWFALRPVWLLACAAVLVPLLALVGRVERRRRPPVRAEVAATPLRTTVVALAVLAVSLGLLGLAVGGLGQGGPAGVPVAALSAYLGGVAALAAALPADRSGARPDRRPVERARGSGPT